MAEEPVTTGVDAAITAFDEGAAGGPLVGALTLKLVVEVERGVVLMLRAVGPPVPGITVGVPLALDTDEDGVGALLAADAAGSTDVGLVDV